MTTTATTATLEDADGFGDMDADAPAAEDSSTNDGASSPASPFKVLNLSEVEASPLNPRRFFGGEAHEQLVASIKAHGVIQPITVRPRSDEHFGTFYEIVAGERRWRAAKDAGLGQVPAFIRPGVTDVQLVEMALAENRDRDDLTPMEEARGYSRVLEMEPGLTQDALAARLGIRQGTISNTLRLMRLPEAVQQLLDRRELSKWHGVALVAVADSPAKCVEFALAAHAEGWTQSVLETKVREFKSAEAARNQPSLDIEEEPVDDPVQPSTDGADFPAVPGGADGPDKPQAQPAVADGLGNGRVEGVEAVAGVPASDAGTGAEEGDARVGEVPEASAVPAADAAGKVHVYCLDLIRTAEDQRMFDSALARALGFPQSTRWTVLKDKYTAPHTITNATLLEHVGNAFGHGGGSAGPDQWGEEHKGGSRPSFWAAPSDVHHNTPYERRKPLTGAELAAAVRRVVWADHASAGSPSASATTKSAPVAAGGPPRMTTESIGIVATGEAEGVEEDAAADAAGQDASGPVAVKDPQVWHNAQCFLNGVGAVGAAEGLRDLPLRLSHQITLQRAAAIAVVYSLAGKSPKIIEEAARAYGVKIDVNNLGANDAAPAMDAIRRGLSRQPLETLLRFAASVHLRREKTYGVSPLSTFLLSAPTKAEVENAEQQVGVVARSCDVCGAEEGEPCGPGCAAAAEASASAPATVPATVPPAADPLVSPVAQALVAALTKEWNAKKPDAQATPAERLEMILLQRAEQAGIDTDAIIAAVEGGGGDDGQ